MQHDKVLILDFGSQYTQLIARRVRELNIYCEIHPFNKIPTQIESYKAFRRLPKLLKQISELQKTILNIKKG